MKLLVFAHTPPPHHGQSYMVELLLGGLGGDHRTFHRSAAADSIPGLTAQDRTQPIQCYHVNARLSKELEDIGDLRIGKLFLLFVYCLQAIWCRFRFGVTNFYYIPAPGKRSALYRDWLVMFLCRPFFKRMVLHWHASGLAKWLETSVQMRSRSITYRLMRRVELSIVLSNYGRRDAEKLFPLRVRIVGNGIPDPCPDFAADLLPQRRSRLAARRRLIAGQIPAREIPATADGDARVVKVLFLAHCTGDKGLFDAVRGTLLAQDRLRSLGSPLALQLIVAGQFIHPEEEAEFRRLCAGSTPQAIQYVGFVAGEEKRRWFEQADIFCFPSYLESFGLVLAEAMAFGLPIVTTRCGAVPEVMPIEYPGLVNVRAPQEIADALLSLIFDESFELLRRRFETHFTLDQYVVNLSKSLLSIEDQDTYGKPQPASASAAS